MDDQSFEEALRHQPAPEVITALADDLNTASALAGARGIYSYATLSSGDLHSGGPNTLARTLMLLGFEAVVDGSWRRISEGQRQVIEAFLRKRAAARLERDFDRADRMRSDLLAAGVSVMDRRDSGRTWQLMKSFDPSRLEALA